MDVFTTLHKDEERSYNAFRKQESDLPQEETLEVHEIIKEISDTQTPVHLILQSPSIEFRSVIWLKDQQVWIQKPQHVATHINFGSILYLDWVEKEEKEHHVIALTVAHPHIPINDRQPGMICDITKSFRHISFQQRLQKRYDVSNRYDCRLKIPGKSTWFRVLDISPEGLRFEILPNQRHLFNPSQRYHHFQLEAVNLKIKNELKVQDLHGASVSCQMGLTEDAHAEMDALIKSLEHSNKAV